MATTENNGLMIYQDESGNKFILYPITKADLVDGLEELLAGKAAAAHAGQHASGGSDPITPAAIGAIAASQTPYTNYGNGFIMQGVREKYYRIATYRFGDGANNSGEMTLEMSHANQYGFPGWGIWVFGRGSMSEMILCQSASKMPHFYLYEVQDAETPVNNMYYVYVYFPKYVDTCPLFCKFSRGVTFEMTDVTDTWDTEIADKTLVKSTVGRASGTGLLVDGKFANTRTVTSGTTDLTAGVSELENNEIYLYYE